MLHILLTLQIVQSSVNTSTARLVIAGGGGGSVIMDIMVILQAPLEVMLIPIR